jgi:hypothetical protein
MPWEEGMRQIDDLVRLRRRAANLEFGPDQDAVERCGRVERSKVSSRWASRLGGASAGII